MPMQMNSLPNRLGEFHLTKFIRTASFTELWCADDLRSQRTVMLEILAPKHLGDKTVAKLLQADFDHGREFDHPNVFHAHEFRTVEGIPFIVRENFPSKSLRQMMLSQREAVIGNLHSVMSQIAAALHHLHNRNWIHGHVRPSCVLLNQRFELKVTGLHSVRRFPQSKISSWFSSSHASGSLNYVSPEQIQNEHADPRSDIYGLGCILFELLEGKPPYSGKSQDELLHKHVSGPIPRVSHQYSNIPEQLGDLVFSMMKKKPQDRPESMLIVQHESNRLFEKEIDLSAPFGLSGANSEELASSAAYSRRGFEQNVGLTTSAAKKKTAHSLGARAFLANQAFLKRHWKAVLFACAVALMVGSFYGAKEMRTSEETKEANSLTLFRSLVEEMETASKGGHSLTNSKDWVKLGERITQAVETYSMEMKEGTSKRPDRLELGWAANLMPRAFINRTGPMGRDDILKVVKAHLDNAEMYKQKTVSKTDKDWQRRMRTAQRWMESDVVLLSLLGLNLVGGVMLVTTFVRKRR